MAGEKYEPELGQMLFGQPSKEFYCPEILDAALEFIRHDLQRILWNLRQEASDPFSNSGASFRCDIFTVFAYSWNDQVPQPWNFKHQPTGLEVSWYKYCGRGMSINRETSPDEIASVLRSCLQALRKIENGEMSFDEPGQYPEDPAA